MKSSKSSQRGASILEFLVTMLLMTIMAFTAIEFGGIFTRLNTLTKSVQDATRFLADNSVNRSNTGAQQAVAQNLVLYNSVSNAGAANLPGALGTVTISNPDPLHVQVSVVYNHTPIAGQAVSNLLQLLGSAPINLSMPLSATSVMRYAQ